ncbi:MAG: Trk system potassium transporter TrkA [Eubacteriales bacterium]|nr:Trk system potassium transporter TrkA [Eubacteriales bacterium]
MYIIIVGDGKVGHELASRLVAEEHEVAIVERSELVLQRNQDMLDAMYIKGNGVSVETLREAAIQRADIVIAVTVSDEVNMLVCLTAKRLGARYAIARIRDPEYNRSQRFLMEELLIDYILNPERTLAMEISRILRYPFAGGVETFAGGQVEMVDFRVAKPDGLAGMSLKAIARHKKHLPQVLVSAVERDGEAIIPKGDFVLREGDRVFVVSDTATITAFFKALGKNTISVQSAMIMGGSRIAFYLARILLETRMAVSIIEIDPEKAREMTDMLPEANIILGDGTDHELLMEEGLKKNDAFITLSGRDEDNIMAGFYAARNGVRKVVVKNNHENYNPILRLMGLDSAVSAKQVTSNTILRTVRTRSGAAGPNQVQRLYRLMDGKAEALEFNVGQTEPVIGIKLKDLWIKPDALVAVIVRNGKVHIPFGEDTLESGDRVIVIVRESGMNELGDIIRRH